MFTVVVTVALLDDESPSFTVKERVRGLLDGSDDVLSKRTASMRARVDVAFALALKVMMSWLLPVPPLKVPMATPP